MGRCLYNGGVSCSLDLLNCFTTDAVEKHKNGAAVTALARAQDFSGLCPSLCDKFLRYAEENFQRGNAGINLDDQHRLFGESNEPIIDHDRFSEIIDNIRIENGAISVSDELAKLRAVGYKVSIDEYERFISYNWFYENLADFDGLRSILKGFYRGFGMFRV